jgi:hypothetical protein
MAIVKKTKNGKTFYWDTVNKKFAKNPKSSATTKKVASATKPKKKEYVMYKDVNVKTKLSKLSVNDIFKFPKNNDGQEYYYYGRVKIMNRFNEVKEYGSFIYGSKDNRESRDIYTDNDLDVILLKKFQDSSNWTKGK